MTTIGNDRERERLRQAALDELELTAISERAYDDLTRLAADIFKTPIALISVVDGDRQWFKSKVGTDAAESPREIAFCDHTIRSPDRPTVVEDASLDPRFADNPLVTGEMHIRFYAAAPLVTSTGFPIGTLCVIDRQPRKVEAGQIEELQFLAQQVVTTMEERRRSADADSHAPRHASAADEQLPTESLEKK